MVDPDEVHEVFRVPIRELVDPAHRIAVRHPRGGVGPGFLIGDDKDVILWGFTAGIVARLFDFVGWTVEVPDAPVRDLPAYMLQGEPTRPDVQADHEIRGATVNVLDWLLVVLVLAYAALGVLAGLRDRRVRDRRAAARRALRGLAGARSPSATRTRRCWSRSARCSS